MVFVSILFSSSFAGASDTEFNSSSDIEGSDNKKSSGAEQQKSAVLKPQWSSDQVKVLREEFKKQFQGIYPNGSVQCTISQRNRIVLAEVLKKTPGRIGKENITEKKVKNWVKGERDRIRRMMGVDSELAALKNSPQAFYEKFKELKEKKKRKAPSFAAVHPIPAVQSRSSPSNSNPNLVSSSSNVASVPTVPERSVRRRIDSTLSVPPFQQQPVRRPAPIRVPPVSSYSSSDVSQQPNRSEVSFSLLSTAPSVYVVELPHLAASATGAPPVILLKFPASNPSEVVAPIVYFQPYSASEAAPRFVGHPRRVPINSLSGSVDSNQPERRESAFRSFAQGTPAQAGRPRTFPAAVPSSSSRSFSASSSGSTTFSSGPCVDLLQSQSPFNLSSLPVMRLGIEDILSL